MTDLDRFRAVVNFDVPDYWPILRLYGLGGVYPRGREKLVREGMPASVNDLFTWCDYWGLLTVLDAKPIGVNAPGIKEERGVEGDFEFVRYETGALTRQVIDNANAYSMPDFQEFHVRDRGSWDLYKKLITPRGKDLRRLDEQVERLKHRTKPLCMKVGGTWGVVRNFMGPVQAMMVIYEAPELLKDIIDHLLWIQEEFAFPVIKALRPEILFTFEDLSYKNGMLISPSDFKTFCGDYYRRVAEVGRECGALLLIVDSDGKVDEFCKVLEELGFNGCCPMEQVCGNEVAEYRKQQPRFIYAGGVEKGIVNTGDRRDIDAYLRAVIPTRLEGRGYFPMFDHRLQPMADFKRLCQCMTVLHEICGCKAGSFPRQEP